VLLRVSPEFARSGTVQSKLVTYFIVGSLIAYVAAKTRQLPAPLLVYGEKTNATIDNMTAASGNHEDLTRLIVIAVISSAVPLHLGILVITRDVCGNVSDSINATLAFAAAYYPLFGIARAVIGEGPTETIWRRRKLLAYIVLVLGLPLFPAHIAAIMVMHRIPLHMALLGSFVGAIINTALISAVRKSVAWIRLRAAPKKVPP